MACLDTTILVDLARHGGKRRERAFKKFRQLVDREETLVTTLFNVAELYIGIARSGRPELEEPAVRAVLAGVGILDFDDTAARLFGQITAHLHAMGRPAGDMDVLIAATSMTAGHCLITRNASHFANIPQLVVQTY